MLQQTRVATAIPFYQRFVARFPTLASLASARTSEVLALWSGLGYYGRARNLHEAARTVVRDYEGRIPDDPERFTRLPGVGRYTTGAVLSLGFDRSLPVLDGNVARVLARLVARPWSVRDARGAKALWSLATSLVPMRGAGEWNQALMELGAIVCMPRNPLCVACPVRTWCRAHALGKVEDFPPVARRRAMVSMRRAVALIERNGRLLLARRSGPLLEGLWEPPGVELVPRERARPRLTRELRRLRIAVDLIPCDRSIHHRITHREITVELWRGDVTGGIPRHAGLKLVDPRRPAVGITALTRKAVRAIQSPARRVSRNQRTTRRCRLS